MTTQAETTLPREMTPALFTKKPPFNVRRMSAPIPSARSRPRNIGDVVQDGPNKGWVYCETAEREPFLVAPKDSGVMMWREAMEYAANQNAELPTRGQLDAVYEARDTGALKDTFNLTGSSAGWYWSATQDANNNAWCQRFSGGFQDAYYTYFESSVRCVRRLSI